MHAQDALGYGYRCLRAERSAPVVVSIHGIVREELKHLPSLVDRVRTRVARIPMERYCVSHAHYLTQPTRYAETYFGDEIRGRIVDVGNAIADRFFDVESAPEPGRILYVGAIMKRKRLLDLDRGSRAGPVDGRRAHAAGRRGVRRTARTPRPSGSASLVSVSRRVSRSSARSRPSSLRRSTVSAALFVLPSGQETSPMGIGEAMAAGVPVIATRTGGVPYLVDEGTTGFVVEVGDVEGLAARISSVLGDPALGAALGRASREVAHTRFRDSAVAGRVLELYRMALAAEDQD